MKDNKTPKAIAYLIIYSFVIVWLLLVVKLIIWLVVL